MKFFGRKKEEERREEGTDIFKELFSGGDDNKIIEAVMNRNNKPTETNQEEQPQPQEQAQAQETQEVKEVKGEEEKKEELPKDRDEVLIEILKELKALNSNVKALIVRSDLQREEAKELTEYAVERLRSIIIATGG